MRSIVIHPDPVLRQVATPVTRFDAWLAELFTDMARVRQAMGGCGIAAPQVGESVRAFLLDPRQADGSVPPRHAGVPVLALVNPVILDMAEEEEWGAEGCLSLPDTMSPDGRIPVKRPVRLRYSGQKPDGTPVSGTLEGFAARAFLHEFDHLEGRLILDYREG
ncbi:MAG: peptide deformylase [Pseudomonadota bacterium]